MSHIGELGEMRAFVRSVELGSFSAAARELKLTPSTLSKLVTRLERAFNVALVKRTTRQIVATPEGELFAERCRRILAEMEDAEIEVSRSRERPRGRLRMHTGPGFGMTQLVHVMPQFLERYPEVTVELVVEDRRIDLARENFDLSITVQRLDHENVVVRKLFEFERITCAAPSYIKRHGMPRTPDDLVRHRCVRVESTLSSPWKFQTPAGVRTLDMRPIFLVNNAAFATQLVFSGAGIAQMMEFQVLQGLREGRLVQVLPQYPCPERRNMVAVYPHERNRLPRVKAMLDFLEETFAVPPWRQLPRARRRAA